MRTANTDMGVGDGSNASGRKQGLKVVLVVTLYFTVSISMVFLNKVLLTEGRSIPAPFFVTWYQCVVTAVILAVLGQIGLGSSPGSFFSQFPLIEYDMGTAQAVMPLSAIFVGMIAFNNLCLKFVELSFYQVARALTMCFNVVFTYLILGETTSWKALSCCAVIVLGFYLGAEGEVEFSFWGTLFGVVSSMFVALNAIYTKKTAGLVQDNKWKLAMYNNLNACVLFPFLVVGTGELSVIAANRPLLYSLEFWTMMTIGGVFGFLIGIIVVFQITLTSPLTHNIAGTAKAAVQTILAVIVYTNPVTMEGALGLTMVLVGSLAYAYVRTNEGKRTEKEDRKKGSI